MNKVTSPTVKSVDSVVNMVFESIKPKAVYMLIDMDYSRELTLAVIWENDYTINRLQKIGAIEIL